MERLTDQLAERDDVIRGIQQEKKQIEEEKKQVEKERNQAEESVQTRQALESLPLEWAGS
jgi:peptidoglycan hydrolase CwlO-like protein